MLINVFLCEQKNMMSVAVNDMNTLGLGLDLDLRTQEAEKVSSLVIESTLTNRIDVCEINDSA